MKDLLILTRDHRALIILLVMPLVFIAILGASTGQLITMQNESALLRIVLANPHGDELLARIADVLGGRDGIDLKIVNGVEAAYGMVDEGARVAAVTAGDAFHARADALGVADLLAAEDGLLDQGLDAIDLHVYSRPTRPVARTIVEQLTFASALRVLAPEIVARDPLVRAYVASKTAGRHESSPASEGDNAPESPASATGNPGSIVYQIIVPGYTVMFTFFLINIMARSFIGERQQGTLLRLHASPVGTGQLLVGKALPFLLVSFAQGVALFLFGKLLFGMSWGNLPWMLAPVIVCTSLAATGLGLLTAVLVKTDAQVTAYATLLVITLAGVSGCFMPREWLPELLRKVSLVTPHAWALIAYDQILVSALPNVSTILICCAVLVAFGVSLFAAASLRYRSQSAG